MNNGYKILILGNSVAIRTRPREVQSLNYGEILKIDLNNTSLSCSQIINKAFSRATIREIYQKKHLFLKENPDLIIFNIGVVDASTREIPLWFANCLKNNENKYIGTIFNSIHHYIFRRYNSFFVKMRRYKTWIDQDEFEATLYQLSNMIKKETNASLAFIGINNGNQRVEDKIPGSKNNYIIYNRIIEKVANTFGSFFIDVQDLTSEQHFPDGIHYNIEGHKVIAARIKKILLQI